tara:strand:+ start:2714 stop:3508 length:795 start_codon:yes stop_codon:yes gene_type:complete
MSDDTITNNIDVNPQKGSPEYNEMMAQKYESQGGDDPNQQSFEQPIDVTPIPEGGLDKFYNKESGEYDWANHVQELEYRLEQTKSSTPTEEAQPAEQNSSLDWDSMAQNVSESGQLSDDNRKALNSAGIPDDIIDNYMDLLNIGQEFSQQRTIEYAGGEENLNGIFDWARNNLSEEEVNNYNEILDSPNWRMAIDSLRVAADANGLDNGQNVSGPVLLEGEAAGTGGQAFASKEQMITAMSDPRYKSDPAFRNQVRLRVGRSNF